MLRFTGSHPRNEARAPLCVVAACVLLTSTLFAQQGPVRSERLSAERWRITITNSEPSILPPADEDGCSIVRMAGYASYAAPGAPTLPFLRLPFAVPPGGSLRAVVLRQLEEQLPADLRLSPAAQPSRLPDALAVSTPWQRNNGVEQAVELRPARYDASSRTVRWIRSMVVDVTIDGASSFAGFAASKGETDPLVLNSADAALWRHTASPPRFAAPDWYRAGEAMLRLRFTDAGVYRVTKEAFAAAGVATTAIDPRTLRVFIGGTEQAARVEGEEDGRFDDGDYVEFYAPRHTGEGGEWFDLWSDENAAFLRWGGDAGRRFAVEDATPPPTPPEASRFARLHLEEDHDYHFGDHKDTDANISEYFEGKTWMWRYLQKKDSLVIPFTLPRLASGPGTLRFRIKHSSADPVRVRIVLNGDSLLQYTIDQNQLSTSSVAIPAGLLREGRDTLVFINTQIVECPPLNPTCTIERMYVDWADVIYPAPADAEGDVRLLDPGVRSVADSTAQRMRIAAAGFTSVPVRGINISKGALLSGMAPSGPAPSAGVTAGIWNTDSCILYSDAGVKSPASVALVTLPDYAALVKDADYIVVTHRDFRQAAERLAQYRRSTDTLRAVVTDVEELYDAFNAGVKHPVAIRNLFRLAASVSGAPPRFATLLGDASWDPKLHMNSTSMTDFVPVWGNPAADNWYTVLSDFPGDITPAISLGRIPAKTLDEAQAVIDKVIEYEAQPPQPSANRFLLSVGGKGRLEQDWYLKPMANGVINNWLTPYCLEPRLILKSNPTLPVTYDDLDTLVSEANAGVNWFYFVGHGGSRIIDVGVERPDIFSLKGKYLFFVTMSCNTAHFAEPYEVGLNERFILARENGAIGTYGTSGVGELSHDEVVSDGLFESMLVRNARTYGEIARDSKLKLLSTTGNGDPLTRNTINQYSFFGDPATHLPLALASDLAVDAADISTVPEIITQLQPTAITAVIANYGRCLADSVDVTISIAQGAKTLFENTRRIPSFLLRSAQTWTHDFRDAVGAVSITVRVAAADSLREAPASNNSATIARNVLPRGVRQIFPLNHTVLTPGFPSVEFVVANPSTVPPDGERPLIELQVDSSPLFAAPVVLRSTLGPVYTWVDWLPAAPVPDLYWWRARLITATGQESWSPVRAFRIDSVLVSGERFRQTDSAQYAACAVENLTLLPREGGVRLGERQARIDVLSAGANQVEINIAALRLDGKDYAIQRGGAIPRGFHVAVIDSASGSVVDTMLFDTYADRANAAAMAAYLDNIPQARTIAVAVKEDANGYPPVLPGGTNITSALRDAFKRFGALLIDSVGFNDSYAFIGSKANASAAQEQWARYGIAQARDTIVVHAQRGSLTSPVIGPATRWNQFAWYRSTDTEGRIDLNVYAPGPLQDTLLCSFANVGQNSFRTIGDSVKAGLHPFVRLQAVLTDTLHNGGPTMVRWSFLYDSQLPEIGITNQVVRASADSVLEGTAVVVSADVYNVGRAEAVSLPVRLSIPGDASGRVVSTVLPNVPSGRDVFTHVELTLPTTGLRGDISYDLDINPGLQQLEYYTGNDVYSKRVRVARDGDLPQLEVRFDGIEIADDDYVAPAPLITVSLLDGGPLPVTDTSAVQLFLDNRRVWLNGNPEVEYTLGGSAREKASIRFTPDLKPAGAGARMHTLAVTGRDGSGNLADTIPYQVRFYVTLDERVDEVYPYPNPSRGATDFTFRVLGASAPEQARLKIFTVAGRLLREIAVTGSELNIGFNRIRWDGRDAEGSELANGVYFYKLVLSRGGRDEERTEKFAILR